MEELFETFDEDGCSTGFVARCTVHRLGLWHRAANVLLFRTDGRLVIQRRHQDKDIWPGAWDLSVAEHLKPGESFLAGANRGLDEELGVTGVDLEQASDVIQAKLEVAASSIRDYELQVTFRGTSDAELKPHSSEVAEVRLITLSALRTEMQASPNLFTPWFRERARDIDLFDLTCWFQAR